MPSNMLRKLNTREASRYIHLMEKANAKTLRLDLSDPCDRSIVDVCVSPEEALELLSLHDRLNSPDSSDFDDTQRISQQEMRAVREAAGRG